MASEPWELFGNGKVSPGCKALLLGIIFLIIVGLVVGASTIHQQEIAAMTAVPTPLR